MDRSRFEAILEAYGARPERWPEAERAEAEAFARAHPELAPAVAEAERLDALLDSGLNSGPKSGLEAPQGMELLSARILAAYGKVSPLKSNRGWVLALAACAVFGVMLGFGGGLLAPQKSPTADAALNAAFGEGFQQSDVNGGEG
jgi:hypothetical protein